LILPYSAPPARIVGIGGEFAPRRPLGILPSAAVRYGQEDIRFHLLTPPISTSLRSIGCAAIT